MVMAEIMEGSATPAQFGSFVTALRLNGETVDEIAGLARTMRSKALCVQINEPVVDTCGTGGDASGTLIFPLPQHLLLPPAGSKSPSTVTAP